LEVSEFQHALHRGLGRAILHLQKHDSTPYRDVILQACLKNTIYDRQSEGGKSVYMMDIIRLTNEKTYYRHHILQAASWINSNTDKYDADHLLDMTFEFAARGNKKARQILYDVFSKHISIANLWWSTRLIHLDKFEGLSFVLNRLKNMDLNASHFSAVNGILHVAEKIIGVDVYAKQLEQARKHDSQIDDFLNTLENTRQQDRRSRTFTTANCTYEELQRHLEDETRGGFSFWGSGADEQSLIRAAHDLLQEAEPVRIKKYLEIFYETPFPLEPQLLFPFVYHPDNHNRPIAIQALRALKNIQHPSVREFALKLIGENHFAGSAVGLLEHNLEDEDWQLIEAVTKRSLADIDYHELQINVRDVFKSHRTKQATQSLLNLYENGRCSFCREYVVAELHNLDALSDTIREECLYDSNMDIRALAKRNFEPKAK
jgi:hypothetical protein